ncbi:GntR family transcriptional regulator [Mycobacterium sp. M26]|uniref:FadR/GntR family transcriptional regulator n=1 Tax=Mycobacterium sp. M26 TaxID=1762962 RepID=UPI00073F2D53|nr:GntR family transcriptional regulator [Mycobacterium sp. M26]
MATVPPSHDAARRAVASRTPQKASHLLAADLRHRILSGELSADQQLPREPELVAQLQVSRDTLREALRILESQQLLEVRRGRGGGAVVRKPGLQSTARYVALLLQLRRTTLADLEEVRSVVEPPAAEQVALRDGTDHLAELESLYETERASRDALAFVAAMSAFDQAVVDLSGNQALGVIAGVFRDIYAGQIYAAVRDGDATLAERIAWRVIASHSAFLEAVRRRDAPLAQRAWSDYLYTTGRMLLRRNVSRQPINMTPLWRAQASQTGSSTRRAMSVATEIRARIAEGTLREGDRLPPLAELGAEFEISRPILREALRILEMEFLLDLRNGDRGGPIIRTPSTRIAAQQAGIVLQARGTTLVDFHRALRVVEPTIMGLVAGRITAKQLAALRTYAAELRDCTDDTAHFVTTWRDAEKCAFAAVKNPALTVIAEILHWVRVEVEPTVTADAKGLPTVGTSNRRAQALFAQFVDATADGDEQRAVQLWDKTFRATAPWLEGSGIGQRLILDVTT